MVKICSNELCDYGCGQEATHQFKNGKWCCSENTNLCLGVKKKISTSCKNPSKETRKKISTAGKGKIGYWRNKKRPSHSEALKGKTWEKIHGKEKAEFLKDKKRKEITGKTWEELFGNKKANTMRKNQSNQFKGKTYDELYGKEKSKSIRKKQSKHKSGKNNYGYLTIKKIKKRYPLFSKIEEMRYNPNKPGEKEIQVHCKNHNCKNSKEKGGWFTPTKEQFKARKDWLEREGIDLCYLYCSVECKQICPLYRSRGADPFKRTRFTYTKDEYNTWKKHVLKHDNYECQKCESRENLQCHHIIPIKIEPMFALDPDNGIVLCENCHYKFGHKIGTECSTGNLSNRYC